MIDVNAVKRLCCVDCGVLLDEEFQPASNLRSPGINAVQNGTLGYLTVNCPNPACTLWRASIAYSEYGRLEDNTLEMWRQWVARHRSNQ